MWLEQAPEVGKQVRVEVDVGGKERRRLWGGKARMVATGYTHTMIVSEDGGLWGCGLNDHGQLGVGYLLVCASMCVCLRLACFYFFI